MTGPSTPTIPGRTNQIVSPPDLKRDFAYLLRGTPGSVRSRIISLARTGKITLDMATSARELSINEHDKASAGQILDLATMLDLQIPVASAIVDAANADGQHTATAGKKIFDCACHAASLHPAREERIYYFKSLKLDRQKELVAEVAELRTFGTAHNLGHEVLSKLYAVLNSVPAVKHVAEQAIEIAREKPTQRFPSTVLKNILEAYLKERSLSRNSDKVDMILTSGEYIDLIRYLRD